MEETNIKLKPKKCIFRVEEGKFLGYVVTPTRVRANPKKIESILKTGTLRKVKEIQSLTAKMVALGQFLAKLAKKSIPFFRVLKVQLDKNKVEWSDEVKRSLVDLKRNLMSLLGLASPQSGELKTM